jgi:1,4-alpha-glucan branching enzyme
MSITKTFFPGKGVCRVVFTLPDYLVDHVKKVNLVGDFNDWHPEMHPMKKIRKGNFKYTLELPLGKDYQFRYLIDGHRWENDWEADGLTPTPYEEEFNSIVKCVLP